MNMNFKGLIYNGTDYSDKYEISDCGKIRRIGKLLLKTYIHKNGYEQIAISTGKRNTHKTIRIHRAVMCTFTNGDYSLHINHINGIKNDNRLNNLEWCTAEENNKHARDTGLTVFKPDTNTFIKLSIPVECYIDNILLNSYNSLRDAERYTGVANQHISACCKGNRKSAGKYDGKNIIWKYST